MTAKTTTPDPQPIQLELRLTRAEAQELSTKLFLAWTRDKSLEAWGPLMQGLYYALHAASNGRSGSLL